MPAYEQRHKRFIEDCQCFCFVTIRRKDGARYGLFDLIISHKHSGSKDSIMPYVENVIRTQAPLHMPLFEGVTLDNYINAIIERAYQIYEQGHG